MEENIEEPKEGTEGAMDQSMQNPFPYYASPTDSECLNDGNQPGWYKSDVMFDTIEVGKVIFSFGLLDVRYSSLCYLL